MGVGWSLWLSFGGGIPAAALRDARCSARGMGVGWSLWLSFGGGLERIGVYSTNDDHSGAASPSGMTVVATVT